MTADVERASTALRTLGLAGTIETVVVLGNGGGSPAEAAQAYIYFMRNGYATGLTLPVDGGGLLV